MKKLFLATCAAVAIGCGAPAALAGDLGLAGSSYDWSGGYVGANAGAGFNNSSFRTRYSYTGAAPISPQTQDMVDSLGYTSDFDEAALTAGILAGYNMQYGHFVFGVEGDFNYVGFEGSAKHDASAVMSQVVPGTVSATDRLDYKGDWFGTLRGRLGYAFDNVLVYGTGGLAYGQLDINQKLAASAGSESASWDTSEKAWKAGWTLGGGIEYAMDEWTLGLEYLYVDLGSFGWNTPGDVSLTNDPTEADWDQVAAKGNADYSFSIARATLKYRF